MGRGQSDEEIRAAHASLQGQALAAASAYDGSETGGRAIAAMLEQGRALVDYEKEIPRLQQQHRRGRDLRIVYAAGTVAAADLLTLVCLVFAGSIYWAWLVVLVPALIAAVSVVGTAHGAPLARRIVPGLGAALLLALAVCADLAVTHVLMWDYALGAVFITAYLAGAWSNGSLGRWLRA